MAKLFIVIKRTGSKRFLGAIPTTKKATMAKLRAKVPKLLKKGYSAKIVTEEQLKKIILTQAPKEPKRRSSKKRKSVIRRKKRTTKRRVKRRKR